MRPTADWIEQARHELDRAWRRNEALVKHALRPGAVAVGQTPKDVIWAYNKAKLYRYHQPNQRHATPLFLVYALINRPYILDLTPGNSLVEYLVGEGYDVYMLDWGRPGEEDAGLTLDDYVLTYLHRAAQQVLRASGQPRLSLLGYCQGGTLSTLYAALHPEVVKNLILLTTPIDFKDAGLYTTWLDPRHFDVDRLADVMGLIPAGMMDLGAKLLKPMQNLYGPYVTLLDRLDDDAFVEGWRVMDQWVNDGVPFPGAAYRQWVKHFYQGNQLVKGELTLGGRPVRLSGISAALLNVYAELDHICQPCQSKPLMDHVTSTDKTLLPVKAGHVGVVAGRAARKTFFPKLEAWLAERS
ncbi:MAG: class III poly(R)-hydroxyalkanoic acid synthase subunit PhaC [Candidatus Sericytochromatia bacterium]|nr:class III poly(R)-hydroxyalkanoic acid synthase subunit PhaC [Candidatus Sericytochromatia bacterium]